MSILEIIAIAVGLAMDAFAVSLAAGAAGYASDPRAVFRLSFHFGLFQFFMPVIGWGLGITVIDFISGFGRWIAFALLAFVGIRMIRSGIAPEDGTLRKDSSKGMTMVLLSLATSIDALAVGLSMAMLNVDIWYPSVIIGVVASGLSLVGIGAGKILGGKFGPRMELAGGILLVGIGVKILAQ